MFSVRQKKRKWNHLILNHLLAATGDVGALWPFKS